MSCVFQPSKGSITQTNANADMSGHRPALELGADALATGVLSGCRLICQVAMAAQRFTWLWVKKGVTPKCSTLVDGTQDSTKTCAPNPG